MADRSEARRRQAEDNSCRYRAAVLVAMWQPRRVSDRVAGVQVVMLVGNPQIELALQHQDHLFVGLVGVRLVAGTAAWFDRRQDDLQSRRSRRCYEFVD